MKMYTLNMDDINSIKLDLERGLTPLNAIFNQMNYDGLVNINKEADVDISVEDVLGDVTATRAEKNRIAREGIWGYVLEVEDDDNVDSIWGLVGDDFYGSGYDQDFYQIAFNMIKAKHVEYGAALAQVVADTGRLLW